jgi:hypothetical protein
VSDRFRERRTEVTISGPLWQKLFRNWKSRPKFEKVAQQLEKLGGDWKFQPEILKVRPRLGFPSGFFQSRPEFQKVR